LRGRTQEDLASLVETFSTKLTQAIEADASQPVT
jgi:hypothetical protein